MAEITKREVAAFLAGVSFAGGALPKNVPLLVGLSTRAAEAFAADLGITVKEIANLLMGSFVRELTDALERGGFEEFNR